MKKIILIYYILFIAGLSNAQNLTNTENYIYTRTYLEPVTIENSAARQIQSVQYFDGLGRAKQGISIKSTVNGKDLVIPVEYDQLSGRQTKSYLPVPVSSLNGTLHGTDGNAANSYYGTANAYSETLLEKSPYGKVMKQAHPGEDWGMGTDHTLKYEYGTNSAGEVKRLSASTTWNSTNLINDVSISFAADDNFTANGYYKSNTLVKKITRDEDNKETQVFSNASGQALLVRKVNKTDAGTPQYTDTYYVYDDYGNLILVVPPKAAAFNTMPELNAQLNTLCYQYRYDKYNRLVESKIPGKANWESVVYDKQNRPVLTQDSNQKTKQWAFVKYDELGRVAYSGLFANTASRVSMQTALNNMSANALNNETRTQASFTLNGLAVYYTNTAFPTGSITISSVNYYDSYPTDLPVIPDKILEQNILFAAPTSITSNDYTTSRSTKSLPTAGYIKNIDSNSWSSAFIWYDRLGRVVGTYGKNHLGGSTRTETELDFSGVPKQSIVYHKRLDTDAETIIKQRYQYDGQNRLLKNYHQVNSQPEELLSENSYNDLGQLISKKVGGNLQTMEYTYNIRGWLTKINDPANLNGKLFGYEMKYTNPVYTNIASGNFNGTVSEVDWKMASDNVQKRYTYGYDSLSRLKDAIYTEPNTTTPFNNNYNENVTYDLNGNIATLKRNAFPVFGTTSTLVDDLAYQYTGNRLDKVTENSLNDTGYEGGNNMIDYDLNGNMTTMKDKGIQSIVYNYLNLPNQLAIQNTNPLGKISTTNITSIYRADGVKLRKTYVNQPPMGLPTTRITDYLDGFQYTYEDNGSGCLTCRTETAYEEQAYRKAIVPITPVGPEWKLDFMPTAEGYYSFTENRYIYQYKDHLGNTRVSFAKNSVGTPETLDTNNYYPFGLNHTGGNGMNSSGFGSWHSYKYNGKELQETGMYDFGARMYMSDLGRWGTIDPLAEMMRRHSPYNYAYNNPVNFVDPDGMAPRQFTSSSDDGYVYGGGSGVGRINPNWVGLGVGGNPYYDYLGTLGSQPFSDDGSGSESNNEDIGISLPNNDGLHFNVPEVIINANGNRSTWNKEFLEMNQYLMMSKLTGALNEANYDANSTNLGWGIAHSKASREVAAVENFLFLELPGSFVGGEFLSAGWRAANLTKYLCGPMGRLTNGLIKICFTEGTLVATEKGNKKIEDIKEGDLVWSYNEETGKKELKKVVELSRNTSSSLVKISVNGTEITCTPEHPFYVNGSWIEAKHLTKGMLLTTLGGKTSPVESINFLDKKVKVYNFEVEGNHNYYVSEKGILVHNDCGYVTEFVAGFYVRGATTMENGVYTRTVQGLANYEERGFFDLVRAFENQAVEAGMDKVVIRGVDIVETRLMNKRGAEILGYTYKELSGNSIELVKFLK